MGLGPVDSHRRADSLRTVTRKETPPEMLVGGFMAWIELLFTDEFGED